MYRMGRIFHKPTTGRQLLASIPQQRTTVPSTTILTTAGSKRHQHTFAIARTLPDSFPNAISSVHDKNDDRESEEALIDMERAKRHHKNFITALRNCVPVLELPAMQPSSAVSDQRNEIISNNNDNSSSETDQHSDSNVITIQPNNDYPDCAFVEDTVIAIGQYALITRLGHARRRGEEDAICNTLQQLGMNVLNMNDYFNSTDWIYGRGRSSMTGISSDPVHQGELATVDGGDVLYTERHIYVGLSDRTNIEGAIFIKQYFSSYDVIVVPQIQIADPAIKLSHPMPLHLKSAVTHIDSETLLAPVGPYGDALLEAMNIEEFGYKVYRVPDLLSCNVISCNGQVIVQDTLCEKSQEILQEAVMDSDQDLIRVDTSELAKKDAALTCCSVLLEMLLEMGLKNNESTKEKDDNLVTDVLQQKTRRRQQIARCVYDVWTWNGAEPCGLAEPILIDGRFDILSNYVMEYYADDIDDKSRNDFDPPCDTTTGSIDYVHHTSNKIDNVDAADLSYNDFCDKYMYRNTPVIIRQLSDSWSCSNQWVINDPITGQLVPNLDYIRQCYGNDTITVHVQPIAGFQCPQQRPDVTKQYNMTVSNYIVWWCNQYDRLDCTHSCEEPLLYLKDWKFVLQHRQSNIYQCPQFFSDDWLNDAKDSAYKFVYLGRKGTTTALHADVLRSFSWSTNICGKKLWYLIAPQYTHLLYDCFGTKLAYHLHADIVNNTNMNDMNDVGEQQQNNFMSSLYPGLRYARKHSISVLQQSGETMFVPSNWFHTVENVANTLSINHNWMNGANIRHCWQYVESKAQRSMIRTTTVPQIRTFENELESNNVSNSEDTRMKIDDDVLLLLEITMKKAENCIKQCADKMSTNQKFDHLGIVFVFDGVLLLYNDKNTSPNVTNVLHEVRRLRNAIWAIAC